MFTSENSAGTGPTAGPEPARPAPRVPATLRDVDALSGLVLVALGGFTVLQSLQLNFEVAGVPGPGFFPAVLGVLLAALGVALVLRRWWGSADAADDFRLPTRSQVGRSLSLWAVVMAGALLVGPLGFPLGMLLLVGVVLFGIERRRGLGAVLTTVLIPVLAWLLFGQLLQVPLPMGPFGS